MPTTGSSIPGAWFDFHRCGLLVSITTIELGRRTPLDRQRDIVYLYDAVSIYIFGLSDEVIYARMKRGRQVKLESLFLAISGELVD